MSNSIDPSIIIGIIIIIIIAFNIGLIAKFKQSRKSNNDTVYHLFLNNLRSPWQEEDAALDELSKLVESNDETVNKQIDFKKIRKSEIESSEE